MFRPAKLRSSLSPILHQRNSNHNVTAAVIRRAMNELAHIPNPPSPASDPAAILGSDLRQSDPAGNIAQHSPRPPRPWQAPEHCRGSSLRGRRARQNSGSTLLTESVFWVMYAVCREHVRYFS